MAVQGGVQRAPRRINARRLAGLITVAAFLVVGVGVVVGPSPALAGSAPKVAVIVGPAGAQTATYRSLGNAVIREALRHTPNVVHVFSPGATWARVKAAISGASVVVFIGRGRGFPSPYSATLRTDTQDGLGLNPVAGGSNSATRYYGERYVRAVRLAPRAVVVLSHMAYASGSSEPGRRQPTLSVARRRVDNYGAGFLAAGASAVIAEASLTPAYYVHAIFATNTSLDSVWRGAPSRHGHVTTFSSSRRRGATGRTDPVHVSSRFERSIIGSLGTTTSAVRQAASPAVTVPTPTPTPPVSGIPVPASVDATGGSDASAALIAFIGSVPDGSTIVFRAGATYRLDAAIKFAHRRNLTLAGNGATLRGHGGTTEASSLFWLGSYGGVNSGIVIRDFSLVGNSTTPGVYQGGKEGAHAILVDGGSGIDLSRVTVSGVWGDCLYVGGSADGVTFHDATCRSNGRNGVTITSGSNVTVQRVAFDAAGYCTFDIEPNQASEAARSIRFLDNTAGTWSNSFLSAEGAAGSVVSGVTVSGNTVTGRSLLTAFPIARRQNVVFTNNRSSVAAAGPVLRFAHVDGLTISGNVQPLSSGSLASISDSTGVTYTP